MYVELIYTTSLIVSYNEDHGQIGIKLKIVVQVSSSNEIGDLGKIMSVIRILKQILVSFSLYLLCWKLFLYVYLIPVHVILVVGKEVAPGTIRPTTFGVLIPFSEIFTHSKKCTPFMG